MAKVPYFAVRLDDEEFSDPMTTDILIDLFDCGDWTERSLDVELAHVKVGEDYKLVCTQPNPYNETRDRWVIGLRRTE